MKATTLLLAIFGLQSLSAQVLLSDRLQATSDSLTTVLTEPAVPTEPTRYERDRDFVLSGQILDEETGFPVAYATIGVNELGIGTVSNMDGNWQLQLPAAAAHATLNIRYLGYTSKAVEINQLPDSSNLKLHQAGFEIGQVVVMPDSSLFAFLRQAYEAIPNNYPIEPTRAQGFYRETQRVNDSLFLYFNEAVLNVYKNTYRNNKNFGQIEIEKSRKNVFPNIDSINDVRFYGGPHFPNDLDIVFSRWDFIKPSQFRDWKFEVVGLYSDSLSEVYTISFKNKKAPNSNFQGRMYIDKNSLAYLGFDMRRAGPATMGQTATPSAASYISGNTSIKIGYNKLDGKYHLNYINYKTNGINTSSKNWVFKDIEYVTTNIETKSVFPIPYNKQFDYTDILSIEAANYDQSYWKDYNILQESQLLSEQTQLLYQQEEAIAQLARTYNQELTQEEKLLRFMKRFTFDGGLSYHPMRFDGGIHQISYNNSPLAEKDLASSNFALATTDGLHFELNKHWQLFTRLSAVLYGMDQVQWDLGINYRHPVFPSGRWVFLDLGLAGYTASSKIKLATMNNSAGLRIDGKEMDSKTLQVSAGQSDLGAKALLGLSVRMGKQYEIFVEGNYALPFIKNKSYVQFKEKEGFFLTRKSAKADWDDPNLNVLVDGNRRIEPSFVVEPWYLRLGIRSGF